MTEFDVPVSSGVNILPSSSLTPSASKYSALAQGHARRDQVACIEPGIDLEELDEAREQQPGDREQGERERELRDDEAAAQRRGAAAATDGATSGRQPCRSSAQ